MIIFLFLTSGRGGGSDTKNGVRSQCLTVVALSASEKYSTRFLPTDSRSNGQCSTDNHCSGLSETGECACSGLKCLGRRRRRKWTDVKEEEKKKNNNNKEEEEEEETTTTTTTRRRRRSMWTWYQ